MWVRLLPFVFVALMLGCIGFVVAAFSTGEWRYLGGAVVCWFILANPTS